MTILATFFVPSADASSLFDRLILHLQASADT